MSDSTAPLLKGIKTALAGVCSGRVYGEVPHNPTYPYAVLTAQQDPFDAADLDGMMHTVRVQIFSRGNPGSALAQRKAVYDALHKQEDSITVTGHTLVQILFTLSDEFLEDDGKTRQAIIEFSALVQ